MSDTAAPSSSGIVSDASAAAAGQRFGAALVSTGEKAKAAVAGAAKSATDAVAAAGKQGAGATAGNVTDGLKDMGAALGEQIDDATHTADGKRSVSWGGVGGGLLVSALFWMFGGNLTGDGWFGTIIRVLLTPLLFVLGSKLGRSITGAMGWEAGNGNAVASSAGVDMGGFSALQLPMGQQLYNAGAFPPSAMQFRNSSVSYGGSYYDPGAPPAYLQPPMPQHSIGWSIRGGR